MFPEIEGKQSWDDWIHNSEQKIVSSERIQLMSLWLNGVIERYEQIVQYSGLDFIRGHPHMISDFFGAIFDLPIYPYPILALYKIYFRLVISDFHKPTYLPKNRISYVDGP